MNVKNFLCKCQKKCSSLYQNDLSVHFSVNFMRKFQHIVHFKIFIVSAIFCSGMLNAFAQQLSGVDSVEHLLNLSYQYAKTDVVKAEEVTYQAIEIAQNLENEPLLADCYIEMSFAKNNLGLLDESADYAFKALDIYQENDHHTGIANALMRIAWNKLEVEEYENVSDYLRRAYHSVKNTSDSVAFSKVYHMMGSAFNWMNPGIIDPDAKDYDQQRISLMDSAIFYNRKAVDIRRRNNIRGLDNSLNNLAIILKNKALLTGEGLAEAEKYYRESLRIRQDNNDTIGIAGSYINLGDIKLHEKDYDTALNYLWKGKVIAEKNDRLFHQRIVYQKLSELYDQTQQYDSALFYFVEQTSIEKRMQSNEYKQSVKELETRYEVSQKEQEIAIQKQMLKTQRVVLIFVVLIVVLLGVTSVFYFRLFRKNKKLGYKNQVLLSELSHRVKNNMQIIIGLLSLQANRVQNTDTKEVLEESQLRIETMGLIHKKLYRSDIDSVYAEDFMSDLIRQVLSAYTLKNVKIISHISKVRVTHDQATCLSLLINELLTNSCKHAFRDIDDPTLHISLEKEKGNMIGFLYRDNGPGFNPEKFQTDSFGMKLINIQVEQLGGTASWQHGDGITFKLEFPMN